jgi:hypothetical protein
MKLIVQGNKIGENPKTAKQEFAALFNGLMTDKAMIAGRKFTAAATRAVRQAANEEAKKLIPMAVSIIDRPNARTYGYSDLMAGATLYQDFKVADGKVTWPDYSDKYLLNKRKHFPETVANYLIRTGTLRDYLIQNQSTIVKDKFGGVVVTVDTNPAKPGKSTINKILLGRIEIDIFPKIAEGMLPMLSSGRNWGATNDGAFDREMFPEEVAKKLADHAKSYRPLILPITQFWMLVRIPNAILWRLKRFYRGANIKSFR